MFLKTYNTEFGEIIITFMDKNRRPLEVEDKVNLTLFINAITNELRTRKYVKGYRFLSFARKYKKQILDKGLDALKTAFPKK